MKLSSINLNLISALKALLDEASVTRAAARLNVTQSAMSKNLAQLRDIFDDRLLIRVGNRLVLTERARELHSGVDAVLSDISRLVDGADFRPVTCSKLFRIATTDYVAQNVLPEALEIISADAPDIRVEITLWTHGDARRLADGSLDFVSCIMDERVEGLRSDRINYDRFVCCMRKGHALAGRLDRESYCAAKHAVVTGGGDKVRPIDDYLIRNGKSRRIVFSTPLFGSALEMVKRSDFLLTIPAHIAYNVQGQYSLHIADLPFDVPDFEYFLFWHESRERDRSHTWFRRRLMQEIRLVPASSVPSSD